MFTVIIGKTCSGKTTIVRKLCEKYNKKSIVTYTNRPPRPGEIQDVTYHFISEKEFKNKIDEGFFAEYKVYDTAFGQWLYGSSLEDILNADDDSVIILTPQGYKDVKDKLSDKEHLSLYIYANNSTIKKRLKHRGDSKEEADRRIKTDNEDFKDAMMLVDRIIYNNSDCNLNETVDEVYAFMEGKA